MTTRVSLNFSDDPDSVMDIDDHAYFRQADSILGNPGRYSHNHALGAAYEQEAQQFLHDEITARKTMAYFALQPDNFLGHDPHTLYGGNPKEYTQGWQRIPGYNEIELDFGNELVLPWQKEAQAQQQAQQAPEGDDAYRWADATR